MQKYGENCAPVGDIDWLFSWGGSPPAAKVLRAFLKEQEFECLKPRNRNL